MHNELACSHSATKCPHKAGESHHGKNAIYRFAIPMSNLFYNYGWIHSSLTAAVENGIDLAKAGPMVSLWCIVVALIYSEVVSDLWGDFINNPLRTEFSQIFRWIFLAQPGPSQCFP